MTIRSFIAFLKFWNKIDKIRFLFAHSCIEQKNGRWKAVLWPVLWIIVPCPMPCTKHWKRKANFCCYCYFEHNPLFWTWFSLKQRLWLYVVRKLPENEVTYSFVIFVYSYLYMLSILKNIYDCYEEWVIKQCCFPLLMICLIMNTTSLPELILHGKRLLMYDPLIFYISLTIFFFLAKC